MNAPIRVFVVDDHSLFREGLVRLLDGDDTMSVVGTAESADEALDALPETHTDVLILDYDLGAQTARHVVRRLRERGFRGRSLVVTAGLPDEDAVDLIRLGVSGIFHKKHSPQDLHRSIREVAAGRVLIDQRYLQNLVERSRTPGDGPVVLTNRDRQVLRLLLEGKSNRDISAALGISESAAKGALQQLFARTGVRTRSQLVRIALEQFRDEL